MKPGREAQLLKALLNDDGCGITPSQLGVSESDQLWIDYRIQGYLVPMSKRRWRLNPEFRQATEARLQKISIESRPFAPNPRLVAQLPPLVNERVAAAVLFGDSKCGKLVPQPYQTTHDEILRMRGQQPAAIYIQGQSFDPLQVTALTGELILPQRRLDAITKIDPGTITRLITVENKGAYIEMQLQPGDLLLFSPGWQVGMAEQFIRLLPAAIRWCHCGDLDGEGLAIGRRLAARLGRPLLWLLPADKAPFFSYWRPLEPASPTWPPRLLAQIGFHSDCIPPVAAWLEQECWALSPECHEIPIDLP